MRNFLKNDEAEPDILSFIFYQFIYSCQNLVPIFPTMQLYFQQFGKRFRFVISVAAHLAFRW